MRRKAIALMIILALAGSILSGCSNLKRAAAAQPMNGKDSLKNYEGTIELEDLDAAYTGGQNEFTYRIFEAMEAGENIFLSPYSIVMALSMLYNGADQGTRAEMAKLLGYDLLEGYTPEYSEAANHYMNANSKLLMDQLVAADPKVKISIANSIWLAKEKEFSNQIEEALLAPVRYYYDGDIFDVDFTEKKTLDSVNEWVSDKTEGMIDPFLEEFSDPENMRVFLANAVYFNGKWSLPFEPKDTREVPFYGEKESQTVDMMHHFNEQFRYYNELGIQAIEVPYGDGRIVMDLLIPEDKQQQSILKLYEGLSREELEDFFKKLDSADKTKIGILGVPKFELEYGPEELNGALAGMGMEEAFIPGEADFELIGEDLYVGRVVHKAVIKVEEWGTKASAATGIEMVEGSAEPEEPLINFIADVPFLFFIRDTATDTILFMGSMQQP